MGGLTAALPSVCVCVCVGVVLVLSISLQPFSTWVVTIRDVMKDLKHALFWQKIMFKDVVLTTWWMPPAHKKTSKKTKTCAHTSVVLCLWRQSNLACAAGVPPIRDHCGSLCSPRESGHSPMIPPPKPPAFLSSPFLFHLLLCYPFYHSRADGRWCFNKVQ